MFRIIALRLFTGCADHIARALHKDKTYFFYHDFDDIYDYRDHWVSIRKTTWEPPVPRDFFCIDDDNQQPEISISAVVGKNGDGKSSLIEAIIRIVNNFAVKAGFLENQDSLTMANQMHGVLFFEEDTYLHEIRCYGDTIELDGDRVTGNKTDLKDNRALFYTIVDNFSTYAYNSKVFSKESGDEDCWINGVFHKNDSYQTPIVLNPMRTEGNFSVNRELSLCRQRLMSLYADIEGFEDSRRINGNKYAVGFAFCLEKESKLYSVTLRKYFSELNVWASRCLQYYYGNYERYLQRIDNGENVPDDYYSDEDFLGQKKFFSLFDAERICRYKALFFKASSIHNDIVRSSNTSIEERPEVKRYLEAFRPVAERYITDGKEELLRAIDTLLSCCGDINGLELQRVCLIIAICERWSNNALFRDDKLYEKVFTNLDELPEERRRGLLYIVYKAISIFSQYKPYIDEIDTEARAFMFFEYPLENNQDFYNAINKCFNALFVKDTGNTEIKDSFETLKLRQTINFLRHEEYKLDHFDMAPKSLGSYDYSRYISFDSLAQKISRLKTCFNSNPIALLPPPIYEGDIIVRDLDKREKVMFPMAELSSGELQMLNSIGTYTYHLRNLDYPPSAEGMIQYKYVNLILEEVELYFHPDYQKQYIYRMLEQIRQIRFTNIKAINIIIVTHSPFVLSDIPGNNILYLNKGLPDTSSGLNPFAANIGDTLKNSFFLENGFMGEFAIRKIESLLRYLVPEEEARYDRERRQVANYHWSYERALTFIEQIGDPLVRGALEGLLRDRREHN